MKKFNFIEITCKSALHNVQGKMPYEWDLNIYRGCQHACKYCFALYSHDYLNDAEYYNNIYIKTNIVEQLERKLKSKNWKQEIINIGGVTDSYQNLESKYKLMPDILKLLIKYKNPAIISTKSDLILRDYDLIAELSNLTCVNLAATIITADDVLRKKLEPNTATIENRFMMLKAFHKTKCSTGIHIMPIIPFITDNYANLNALLYQAKNSQVDYVLPGILNLRGKTREAFFNFLKNEMPYKYKELWEFYNNNNAIKDYKILITKTLNELLHIHKLSNAYLKPISNRMKELQDQEYLIR